MPGRQPLGAYREDVAGSAIRLAARLLIDLADQLRAVVARLVLHLAQQQLLRLGGAQARDLLELRLVLAAARLEALARLLEPGPPAVEVTPARGDLLLGRDHPLAIQRGGVGRRLRTARPPSSEERGGGDNRHSQHACRDHDVHGVPFQRAGAGPAACSAEVVP